MTTLIPYTPATLCSDYTTTRSRVVRHPDIQVTVETCGSSHGPPTVEDSVEIYSVRAILTLIMAKLGADDTDAGITGYVFSPSTGHASYIRLDSDEELHRWAVTHVRDSDVVVCTYSHIYCRIDHAPAQHGSFDTFYVYDVPGKQLILGATAHETLRAWSRDTQVYVSLGRRSGLETYAYRLRYDFLIGSSALYKSIVGATIPPGKVVVYWPGAYALSSPGKVFDRGTGAMYEFGSDTMFISCYDKMPSPLADVLVSGATGEVFIKQHYTRTKQQMVDRQLLVHNGVHLAYTDIGFTEPPTTMAVATQETMMPRTLKCMTHKISYAMHAVRLGDAFWRNKAFGLAAFVGYMLYRNPSVMTELQRAAGLVANQQQRNPAALTCYVPFSFYNPSSAYKRILEICARELEVSTYKCHLSALSFVINTAFPIILQKATSARMLYELGAALGVRPSSALIPWRGLAESVRWFFSKKPDITHGVTTLRRLLWSPVTRLPTLDVFGKLCPTAYETPDAEGFLELALEAFGQFMQMTPYALDSIALKWRVPCEPYWDFRTTAVFFANMKTPRAEIDLLSSPEYMCESPWCIHAAVSLASLSVMLSGAHVTPVEDKQVQPPLEKDQFGITDMLSNLSTGFAAAAVQLLKHGRFTAYTQLDRPVKLTIDFADAAAVDYTVPDMSVPEIAEAYEALAERRITYEAYREIYDRVVAPTPGHGATAIDGPEG